MVKGRLRAVKMADGGPKKVLFYDVGRSEQLLHFSFRHFYPLNLEAGTFKSALMVSQFYLFHLIILFLLVIYVHPDDP